MGSPLFDSLDQELHGRCAEFVSRLIDRGERDVLQASEPRVVVSDEGNIVL